MTENNITRTDLDFWNRAALTADIERCWNWLGPLRSSKGYGAVSVHSRLWSTHRYSWFLATGKIPTKWILHKCDNPRCVNPNHLYEGTAKQNRQDAILRERLPLKLNPSAVLDIRRRIADGEPVAKISKRYGVLRNAIYAIKNGDTWTHI